MRKEKREMKGHRDGANGPRKLNPTFESSSQSEDYGQRSPIEIKGREGEANYLQREKE